MEFFAYLAVVLKVSGSLEVSQFERFESILKGAVVLDVLLELILVIQPDFG